MTFSFGRLLAECSPCFLVKWPLCRGSSGLMWQLTPLQRLTLGWEGVRGMPFSHCRRGVSVMNTGGLCTCLPCGPWGFLSFPRVKCSSQGLQKAYPNTEYRILFLNKLHVWVRLCRWSHKAPWLVHPRLLPGMGRHSFQLVTLERSVSALPSHVETWDDDVRPAPGLQQCSVGRYSMIPLHDSSSYRDWDCGA